MYLGQNPQPGSNAIAEMPPEQGEKSFRLTIVPRALIPRDQWKLSALGILHFKAYLRGEILLES